ncbi:MAG: AAA family ATPase [Candidatus Hydrogenedentes bacterium]|nr:AAA family ATPase [Candidatus Hydrogenedentota bacterium]
MEAEDAKRLSEAKRAALTAPAGCGKTHLIATAVAKYARGRELILTHTHAGVDALRRKLRDVGASCSAYHVDTIAGFALRYAAAFPVTSCLATPRPTGNEWNGVYSAAARLFRNSPVRDIVQMSYSGLYVDEYQDCILEQHDLVLALAETLPCRILGDPLQGIFDFGKNKIVDWANHIEGSFDSLPALREPWRWANTNPELGSWFQGVRDCLMNSSPVDLRGTPVCHVRKSGRAQAMIQAQTNLCFQATRDGGSVVAIHQWPAQCHKVAQRLKGLYQCIEPIDCRELIEASEAIFSASGPARAAAVIDFAKLCLTTVGTDLSSAYAAFGQGRLPTVSRRTKHVSVVQALTEVAQDASLGPVVAAIKAMRKIPKAVLYRGDLYREMLRALGEFQTGAYENLREAAWATRNRTSHAGRRLSPCTVGRTVLVKGLEFDHAVLLDTTGMTAKNLYVALTRGARTLTMVSPDLVLPAINMKAAGRKRST